MRKKAVEPQLEVPYPHQWIFTMDATAERYVHLELFGNNMKRTQIDKTYPLSELTLERFCEFNVAESKTEVTNQDCYTIQFERERGRWVFATRSSNQQEIHLWTTWSNNEFDDPGGDQYKFFIHELPRENGVRTVSIESVLYPGYYISNSPPGFNYSQTQVTLTSHTGPQSAPAWQCRSAK